MQGQAHEAATGAQQLGSQTEPQDEPHDEPHPLPQPKLHLGRRIFGQRSFGRRIFGHRSFGILKQLLPQPHPHPLPQLSQQLTGAQQVASQAGAHATGAQQLGSAATPQPLPQPESQAAGAQQLASTGAQQLGSGAHPHPPCLLNKPACTLLAIENTTRAAVSVNAFIEFSWTSFVELPPGPLRMHTQHSCFVSGLTCDSRGTPLLFSD